MKLLGNLFWMIFGGLPLAISWTLAGLLWCVTIVGIPVGVQCFKFARLAFLPFGKHVEYSSSPVMFIVNVIWLVLSGVPLFLAHMIVGIFFCLTIVGIPFGLQSFKLAQLALLPFGATVRND